MKILARVVVSFCIFLFAHQVLGQTIACSHPELCRLAQIIYTEHAIRTATFLPMVNITGDPHEYEPTPSEIKNLIKAPVLIIGPYELNPWAKKIRYQRTKTNGLITLFVDTKTNRSQFYASGSKEAFAHLWLYPRLFCEAKVELEKSLHTSNLLPLPKAESIILCQKMEKEIEAKLKGTLKNLSIPIILSHDALLPLFKTWGNSNVVAVKGSNHHEEANPDSVKKLYDLLKAPQVIWIEENGIPIPANLLAKKRKEDIYLKIESAHSSSLNYFQILEDLNLALQNKGKKN